MKKQKIHCVIIDRDAEITASLEAALHSADAAQELERIASMQQLVPVLSEHKPHLLFCPQLRAEGASALLENLQRHSPDTLLVQISRTDWQGLTTWLSGVESCTLPIGDVDYFAQYIDFLLRYARMKHEFRQCKQLLSVAELRCHWLVDYSWEAIAYVAQGTHLYANHAYISLFGFESVTALRATPVSQLVDHDERHMFEALGRAADVGNRPSNRLLTTLRTLTGEIIRAEIRFIPAVLKGKRCYQLHVRPLERVSRSNAAQRERIESPWDKVHTPADTQPPAVTLAVPRPSPEAPKPHLPVLAGMQEVFVAAMRLRESQPPLYFAEPVFQPQTGRRYSYGALIRRVYDSAARFRLDYWNLGQTILHLSARKADASNYLVFVSVGEWIFDNEGWRKRFLALLAAAPRITRRIVLAVQYQDCISDVRQLSKVNKLLRASGVHFAVDNVLDDARMLKFIQALKPVFVRLAPELAANVALDTEEARYLHKLTHQLSEIGSRVIVKGVNDVATLNLVCATSAAYLQGQIVRHD